VLATNPGCCPGALAASGLAGIFIVGSVICSLNKNGKKKEKKRHLNQVDWGLYCGSAYKKITHFSDQASEAGNEKYCYDLHARSGLIFAIRLQENA
jgi:hypothetical protein